MARKSDTAPRARRKKARTNRASKSKSYSPNHPSPKPPSSASSHSGIPPITVEASNEAHKGQPRPLFRAQLLDDPSTHPDIQRGYSFSSAKQKLGYPLTPGDKWYLKSPLFNKADGDEKYINPMYDAWLYLGHEDTTSVFRKVYSVSQKKVVKYDSESMNSYMIYDLLKRHGNVVYQSGKASKELRKIVRKACKAIWKVEEMGYGADDAEARQLYSDASMALTEEEIKLPLYTDDSEYESVGFSTDSESVQMEMDVYEGYSNVESTSLHRGSMDCI